MTGGGSHFAGNGVVIPAFRRTIADLFKARFPFLYVQTWEEDRVVAEVAAVVSESSLIRTPPKPVRLELDHGPRRDGGQTSVGD